MLVEELHEVLGDEESEEQAEASERLPCVYAKTHRVVTVALLAHVDGVLDDIEWVLSALRTAARPASAADTPLQHRAGREGGRRIRDTSRSVQK